MFIKIKKLGLQLFVLTLLMSANTCLPMNILGQIGAWVSNKFGQVSENIIDSLPEENPWSRTLENIPANNPQNNPQQNQQNQQQQNQQNLNNGNNGQNQQQKPKKPVLAPVKNGIERPIITKTENGLSLEDNLKNIKVDGITVSDRHWESKCFNNKSRNIHFMKKKSKFFDFDINGWNTEYSSIFSFSKYGGPIWEKGELNSLAICFSFMNTTNEKFTIKNDDYIQNFAEYHHEGSFESILDQKKIQLKNDKKYEDLNLNQLEEIRKEAIEGMAHTYEIEFYLEDEKYLPSLFEDFCKFITEDENGKLVCEFEVLKKFDEQAEKLPAIKAYLVDIPGPVVEKNSILRQLLNAIFDRYKNDAKTIKLEVKLKSSYRFIREKYKKAVEKGDLPENILFDNNYEFFKGYEFVKNPSPKFAPKALKKYRDTKIKFEDVTEADVSIEI